MDNPKENIELPMIHGQLEIDIQKLEFFEAKIRLPIHFIRSETKSKTYFLIITSLSVQNNVLTLGFKVEGGILPVLFNLIKSLFKYKVTSLVNKTIFEGETILTIQDNYFVMDLNPVLQKENMDISITKLKIDSGIDIQFE